MERHMRLSIVRLVLAAHYLLICGHGVTADPDVTAKSPPNTAAAKKPAAGGGEETWTRLDPEAEIWVDMEQKRVIAGGEICLRRGMLEMFACPKRTKEHEAIVAVNGPARLVHAGLLAIGAQPGSPVQFRPAYAPARGPKVKVFVEWKDKEGKTQKADARTWIRETRTGKEMTHDWVFTGSRIWTDPETKKNYYQADGGEMVCVSNFSTAMLDLPVASPDDNDQLYFEAFMERIPEEGTQVKLIFVPELDK